jgi:hypothetical protein
VRTHSLTPLSRPLAGLVFTVLIALAPAACRKAPETSDAYEEAHQRFSKLYGQKLDGAFGDPQMDEIEALLDKVPQDSLDWQSSRELKQRITEGRARVQAQQQEQEDALAAARAVDPSLTVPEQPSGTPEPAPAPAAPRDAGPSEEGPVEGTPASELTAGYLGCFQRGNTVNVDGRGPRESWEMSDRARCSQSYPRFVGQVVLIEDGKVLTVLPKSAFRMTWKLPDGGTVGAPNGGR